jgi:hypothetical protein
MPPPLFGDDSTFNGEKEEGGQLTPESEPEPEPAPNPGTGEQELHFHLLTLSSPYTVYHP